MSIRDFWFWPSTGSPQDPWDDAGVDAFARTARSVCESVRDHLVSRQLQAKHREIRFGCVEGNARAQTIEATVSEGGWIGGALYVPKRFAELNLSARVGVIEMTVAAILREIGNRSGWPQETATEVVSEIAAAGFAFEWTSDWKSSRNRRRRVRAVYRLTPHAGYGQCSLELEDRERGTFYSPAFEAFSTLEGFRRSAKTLRWLNADEVRFLPYGQPFEVGYLQFEERWALCNIAECVDVSPLASPGVEAIRPRGWDVVLR
jgi:hypothetical protein